MAATQYEIVHEVLDLAGARWTVEVLSVLRSGRRRFNEIAREVSGISQKQLTLTLRTLQRDGFATRAAFATIPPRVEYELTALGLEFANSVRPLGAFAVRNRDSIEAARRAFDGPAE
ncbi:MAG: helix-turn-helix transcriptional regulator [Devosia sp.]|uniref:winged helix-turn-helix transcriptional regulator n=1 Tax=Devosia sp. TaxID=1871048 RepID=UPI001AC61110|nr:helix-turn-helix domain-containing protein [Devosia sp.]MBN9309580.1 helix-turn-helix transcriptional regulator [Devosia sp.]MBN9317947.1 helix-turn-helix transcriptional regulator [Devosia sp.]